MGVTSTEKSSVVGVRFQKLGKLYHFYLNPSLDVKPQDHVIVETSRGLQMGQIVAYINPDSMHAKQRKSLKAVNRKATPRDLVMKQVWESKELEALITCRARADQMKIKKVKFVKAEYSYDGAWLTIQYTTNQKKLNVSGLKKSLSKEFNARVEMRSVGPRDVARILGGYGACGSARCCSTFLTEFSPVSIRMAKAQGISLSPQEITGMCGRLRCCLVFEYEQYVEAKKHLPKFGKRIDTPHGKGRVCDVRVLRDSVVVELANGDRKEVFRNEFEPSDELEAFEKKAAEGGCSSDDHANGGGCSNCGAK